jgi:rubrerythrin
MAQRSFEELYGRTVTIDICNTCQGFWFDGTELLRLSPGATLELFRAIAGSGPAAAGQPGPHACPRCNAALAASSDLQNTTRFFFERCPDGHGRYMTFFQFLRAKSFVRSLNDTEVRQLRDAVQQVNCSNCGAPLDIERSASCAHCRTPVSIIDPKQLEATVRRLSESDAKRKAGDPTLPVTLAMERLRTERAFEAMDPRAWTARTTRQGAPVDLILVGLEALKKVLG